MRGVRPILQAHTFFDSEHLSTDVNEHAMLSLSELLQSGESSVEAKVSLFLRIRYCVARLVGERDERILWDTALFRAAAEEHLSESAIAFLRVLSESDDCALTEVESHSVALNQHCKKYLALLSEIIGYALIDYCLRSCLSSNPSSNKRRRSHGTGRNPDLSARNRKLLTRRTVHRRQQVTGVRGLRA